MFGRNRIALPLLIGALLLLAIAGMAMAAGGDAVLYFVRGIWEDMGFGESRVVLIQWEKNLDAVRYELEVFVNESGGEAAGYGKHRVIYHEDRIYTRGKMLRERDLFAAWGKDIYWRVRPVDLDGRAVSGFSRPRRLIPEQALCTYDAPVPLPAPADEYGAELLYPVYAFIGNPGAVKFEIEVTSQYPENLQDARPSRYRIYANQTELMDLYDEEPRIGDYYWRVRGMDAEGHPVGCWSRPERIHVGTGDHWTVGVYGDSISHGGGHLSFSPSDLEYSYTHYLDFPTINLSYSGSTTEDMVNRFERDVLPFRLKYLLIMGGTNSLRGGVPAESVIQDLQTIQRKCREHGIVPILLTLAPINPRSIERVFHETTARDWKPAFQEVNAFIRTQAHMDTAAPFRGMEEMPEDLSLDGLHGDWRAKRMMADAINRAVRENRMLEQ